MVGTRKRTTKGLGIKKYLCDVYLICALGVDGCPIIGADSYQEYDFLKSHVSRQQYGDYQTEGGWGR